MLIMIKGDKVDALRLNSEVSRRILQKFQRLFGVPVHHFYHPLMAPAKADETIQ